MGKKSPTSGTGLDGGVAVGFQHGGDEDEIERHSAHGNLSVRAACFSFIGD